MKLERDPLTWLTYAQLGAVGYFLYGLGATLGLLREDLGVSRTVVGLHGTAVAVGSMVSALAMGVLVRRVDRSWLVWGGLALLAVGTASFATVPFLPLTLGGALVASLGSSAIVTVGAAVLADRHGHSAPAAITEANAAAAGVGALAPLTVGAAVGLGLGWRVAMLMIVPIAVLVAVLGRTVSVPAASVRGEGRDAGRLPGRFWVSWVVVTAGVAVEFSMALWAADLLHDRAGMTRGGAAAGITTIILGMFLGRVVGGRLALSRPVDRLVQGAIVMAAVGFFGFWVSDVWPVSVLSLFVAGLGISLFYPLGVARAIAASHGKPDHASARAGLGASLAIGLGPFGLGALADAVGLHLAFLVVPALLLVASLGVRLGPHPHPPKTGELERHQPNAPRGDCCRDG